MLVDGLNGLWTDYQLQKTEKKILISFRRWICVMHDTQAFFVELSTVSAPEKEATKKNKRIKMKRRNTPIVTFDIFILFVLK